MCRCTTYATAEGIARERGLWFGLSVFGGDVPWFVGTAEELRRIGCPEVLTPEEQ